MNTVRDGDPKPFEFGVGSLRQGLTTLLETTDVAINRYRIAPGDGLPGGLHAHADQEEVFYVLEGTATFETMEGTVTLAEDEAVRFGRGEFQSGKNAHDRELVLLAIGAPRESQDVRIPAGCPACEHDDLRLAIDGHDVDFVCPACGARHIPDDCPECGTDDLRIVREEGTITRCRGCGSDFERPPLRDG